MSQTISPIDWLRTTLSWFFILDIVENTTSNASGQLWTCELSFSIPLRGANHQNHIHETGRQSPDMISAQFSAVRICLEALRRVCYDVPDFSHFKALALNAGDIPIPQASEWFASYNRADVVKWSLIVYYCLLLESWLFIVYYCNNILYFFSFSPHADCALGPYLCCMWLVGHSRPSYRVTWVWLGLLQW